MFRTFSALFCLAAVTACQAPPAVTEDIRPVRVLKVQPATTDATADFAGEVRPRVETRAGFLVAGRITQRKVDVGQSVKSGDLLATIDPQDYRLAAQAAAAGLTAAKVERDQQRADFKRFEELQSKGFISQADLDRRRATLDAAEARYQQAAASSGASDNQAAHSALRAPHDAVVVGIDAEVGQVVDAGQSVVRLARVGEKEVVVGIPEQQLALLRDVHEVTVRLWAGGPALKGTLREVSPVADPTTRTFPVRITLVNPPAGVALGMTATVTFSTPLARPVIAIPLQALLAEGGATHAWIVDDSTTVRRQRVEVANVAGNDVVIASGLKPGDVIVTAGVNQLKEGQKVKLLGEERLEPAQPTTVKVATDKKV